MTRTLVALLLSSLVATAACSAGATDGEVLVSVQGDQSKSDSPDWVASWELTELDDAVGVVGKDEDGEISAFFSIRAINLRDQAGAVVADGIAITSSAPESGYLEMSLAGELHEDRMSPRQKALFAQFVASLDYAGKADAAEVITDSVCLTFNVAGLAAIFASVACPFTAVTCPFAAGASITTAVAFVGCVTGAIVTHQ